MDKVINNLSKQISSLSVQIATMGAYITLLEEKIKTYELDK